MKNEPVVKYKKPAGLFTLLLHIFALLLLIVTLLAGVPIILNQTLLPGIFSILAVVVFVLAQFYAFVMVCRSFYIKFWIDFE